MGLWQLNEPDHIRITSYAKCLVFGPSNKLLNCGTKNKYLNSIKKKKNK